MRINYREQFSRVVGYAFKTDKRPEIVGGNIPSRTPNGIINEFSRLAVLNSRCKTPVAHLAFSLPPGEYLSGPQWAWFSEQVAAEYGFEQFVAVRHGDTDCEHIHLIGNRIKLDGKAAPTSNDRHRMRALCQRAEKELILKKTPERSQAVRVNRDELAEADRLYRQGKARHPVPRKLLVAEQVKACAWKARTAGEFMALCKKEGIGVRWRKDANGKTAGVSFAAGRLHFSGSGVGLPARRLISTIYHYGKYKNATTRSADSRVAGGAYRQSRYSRAAVAGTATGFAHRSGASHQFPARPDRAAQRQPSGAYRGAAWSGGNVAGYTKQEKYQMIEITQNILLRVASSLTDWLDSIDADLDVSTRAMRPRNVERRLLL